VSSCLTAHQHKLGYAGCFSTEYESVTMGSKVIWVEGFCRKKGVEYVGSLNEQKQRLVCKFEQFDDA